MNLNELELFVNKEKHLPGIPSEQELQESGINVTDIITKQMKKIEELTLYIIKLEKRISKLEKYL